MKRLADYRLCFLLACISFISFYPARLKAECQGAACYQCESLQLDGVKMNIDARIKWLKNLAIKSARQTGIENKKNPLLKKVRSVIKRDAQAVYLQCQEIIWSQIPSELLKCSGNLSRQSDLNGPIDALLDRSALLRDMTIGLVLQAKLARTNQTTKAQNAQSKVLHSVDQLFNAIAAILSAIPRSQSNSD